MANFEHIIHKNSNVVTGGNPKLPTTAQLAYGELAVNYAKDKETISLKNSNNEIVTFSSDSQLVKKTDLMEVERVTAAALNDLEDKKLDKEDIEDYYTKEEIDEAELVNVTALNDLNSRIEGIETNFSDLDDYFNEMELIISSALNDLEENKLGKEDFESLIGDYYTREEADELAEVTAAALNDLEERKLDMEDLGDYYTKEELDEAHLVVASALNDLEDKKLDKEDIEDYYTKEEIDNDHLVISSSLNELNTRVTANTTNISNLSESKQNALVSGTNIKTINNESILGSGNITIQGGGSGDVNIIESVKVNGTALTPDANKAVDITAVPASIVTQDTTHRFVSDTEKTTWNGVSNKADKSAAIGSLSLSLNSTNYQITLSGTKVDGTSFTVSDVIDLPLESVVVNGSYNNTTKKVVLTLQNGSTVDFSVADLVSGLQSEITSANKLSADLISDGTTNKTVTATEKNTWNGKQDALSNANVLSGITSTKISNWDSAATNSHTHSNKTVLDGISSNDISNWNSKTDNVGTVTGVKMNGTTNNPTSGVVDLGTVITSETSLSKGTTTGGGNAVTDISVSGHQITLTKGTTFLTSHQSIKTLNGTALTGTGDITLTGVPAFTASDNGKILGVVNGQLAWITPTTIYTGSGTPSSSQGNNGDIYLQTS